VKPRKIGGEDRWRRRPQAPITFAQDLFNCACGFFCLAQSGERPERWVLPAWADRYPLIAEATGGLQVRRWRRRAGVERLRYRRADHSVFLFAFDLLEINGQDLRREPPEVQKARSLTAKAWTERPSTHRDARCRTLSERSSTRFYRCASAN
jgi:hypothetical protein